MTTSLRFDVENAFLESDNSDGKGTRSLRETLRGEVGVRAATVPLRYDTTVVVWACPACGRQFGRNRQSHECSPAMTVEDYFSTGPPHERPVFDAVMAHLATVGPVHVEPVSVGIFLKNPWKFAELRPMQRWVSLSFSLQRAASHRTIVRKVIPYGGRYWHTANVAAPSDLDAELCDLLTQAYVEADRNT